MDLNLTNEEIAFRDELRAWLKASVPKDWDERRESPMEARFDYLKVWQRKLYEGGWAGISWPKEYGGRGARPVREVNFLRGGGRGQRPPPATAPRLRRIGPP